MPAPVQMQMHPIQPLGGVDAASGRLTVRLSREGGRAVAMTITAPLTRGGYVRAADLMPEIADERQIRLNGVSALKVAAEGRFHTLYLLTDGEDGGALYVSYDAANPPPLDTDLLVVETRRLH